MARPATDCKRYATLSTTRKCHRHIPLTGFTLLTVPEGSMLSEFEKSDTVDFGLRLMYLSRQTEDKTFDNNFESQDKGTRQSATTAEESTAILYKDKAMDTSITQDHQLEIDLDKFMDAVTAHCAPKDVIKTIAVSKGSIARTSTGCGGASLRV